MASATIEGRFILLPLLGDPADTRKSQARPPGQACRPFSFRDEVHPSRWPTWRKKEVRRHGGPPGCVVEWR